MFEHFLLRTMGHVGNESTVSTPSDYHIEEKMRNYTNKVGVFRVLRRVAKCYVSSCQKRSFPAKGRENFVEKTVHLNRAFEDEQYLDIQKQEVFHREEGAYSVRCLTVCVRGCLTCTYKMNEGGGEE